MDGLSMWSVFLTLLMNQVRDMFLITGFYREISGEDLK